MVETVVPRPIAYIVVGFLRHLVTAPFRKYYLSPLLLVMEQLCTIA